MSKRKPSTPRGSTPRPSRCSRRRWRSAAACSPTTTPTPPPATTTWRPTSTPRGSTPRPSRCSRRRWRSAAACSPTTTPTPPTSYNNLAANLNAQGKYAAGPAAVREGAGDPPPPAHRRPPRHRPQLQQPGGQPQRPGEVRPGPAAATRRRWRSAAACSPTTTPTPPPATTTWRPTSTPRGSTPRPSRCFEKALEIRRRLLTDDHPDTAHSYNNLAVNLNAQGKYAQAQPLLREGAGDPPPPAHRRPPRHRHQLQQRGGQPQRPGEVRRRPSRCSRRRWRSAAACSPTTTPTPPAATTTWRPTSTPRGSTPQAQPLFEKALEIRRRLLTDDHPDTATSYNNLAANLNAQGKYAQAQPLYEKALEIRRRLLTDDHPDTAHSYNNLAANLNAQGKYLEARDQWLRAVKSLDTARLRVAFTGLERAGTEESARPALAAVLARLGQPAEAWQSLEEDLGRGLLDELAARQDQRLAPAERARLRELTAELERLDKLVETTPKDLDQAERAKRFEDLKRQRELASIALGEFQTKLVQDHGPLAGQVATLNEIQAALPADAALVAWVDIPPAGPNAADPDGEHWGVVVRSRGIPAWVPIAGTGPDGLWTKDDTGLAGRVRTELRSRPGAGPADLRPLVERLRTQRLEPLAKALGATADGLPPARRLIVLPSRAMAGIPIEALLAPDDTRTVSYAPSATVFKYLREQPRPDRHAGLLALGDPVYERPDTSSEPKPLPDHGLLVNVVAPGSNAATHGLKPGDVLLAYNGPALQQEGRPEGRRRAATSRSPSRSGETARSSRRDLAPGKLGVVLDPRPAPDAIAANRSDATRCSWRRGRATRTSPPCRARATRSRRSPGSSKSDDRPTRILLGADASEPELDRLAASGELGRFGFIHLATHGVIDEGDPRPLGGDPDPDRLARPAGAGPAATSRSSTAGSRSARSSAAGT